MVLGDLFSARSTGPATWTCDWTPPFAGSHRIAVRATDGSGNPQPEAPVWNEGGYGNNVVQAITVHVVDIAEHGLQPSHAFGSERPA